MTGRPSCWYDCNGCGDCEPFREYMEEIEDKPDKEELSYEDQKAVSRMLHENQY